jgi:arylsulfatase A-like enzyme
MQPNFLFIVTDQHRADHTRFGGNPVVRTPNLDAIAARGTVFDRAFVSNPICSPNRATIHTGRMPSVHGTRVNGISLDWQVETFVRRLRASGYRTAHVGKSHLQTMGVPTRVNPLRLAEPGEGEATRPADTSWDGLEHVSRFEDEGRAGFPDDFYGYGHVDMVTLHGDMCSGHYLQWLRERVGDYAGLRGSANAIRRCEHWAQVYQTAVPVELYPTSYVTEHAVAQIEAAASDERPFFLHCSYPDPHHPFTPPGDYAERYDPGEILLPESFDDPHINSMPHVKAMIEKRGTPGLSVHGWAVNEDQYRHAAAAEYGMIELIDVGVGQLLGALERAGVADDTVIVFTSDHGDMFGDHGLMLKHALHYEGCTRVPLVIAHPDRPSSRTNQLASSIDLAPTFLELAGAPAYHGMQGHSLVPALGDPSASVRDAVLIEEDEPEDWVDAGVALRMRTLVTPRGRITTYRGHERGELYDHENDPLELENLWDRPESRSLQSDMLWALHQAMLNAALETPRATHQA